MTPIGVTVMERLIKILEDQNRRSGAVAHRPAGQQQQPRAGGAGIDPVEDVGPWLDAKPLKFLHIVASDAPDGGAATAGREIRAALLEQIDCVVVQAGYRSPLTEAAHVVLPAAIWCEKSGTITNLEGRQLTLRPVLPVAVKPANAAILESVFA